MPKSLAQANGHGKPGSWHLLVHIVGAAYRVAWWMRGVGWHARKGDRLSLEYVECVPLGAGVWYAASCKCLGTRELSPMAVRFGISVLFLCVRHIRASKANARYPENSAGNSGLGNSKCQQHSCGE